MLQRATKVKAASVGVIMPTLLNDLNFLRGFEDKCQEWGIKEKAEVDNFLKTAALTIDLTRPLHEIEKEAGVDPYATMLGAGLGMGAGGLIGYIGTEDEEKKMQNAMLGALVGAPIGGYAGASLSQAGATEKANLAKAEQLKKIREAPERAAYFDELTKKRIGKQIAKERGALEKEFDANPLNKRYWSFSDAPMKSEKYIPGRVREVVEDIPRWWEGTKPSFNFPWNWESKY